MNSRIGKPATVNADLMADMLPNRIFVRPTDFLSADKSASVNGALEGQRKRIYVQ